MNICPNQNSREWRNLENSIGKVHTMTYWMSTGGELKDDPIMVLNELAEYYPEKKDVYEALSYNLRSRTENPETINYVLKTAATLLTDKAVEVFKKGTKNNWPIDKILTELQISKEQKQLVKDSGATDINSILTYLTNNYSFGIELRTAYENLDRDGLFSDDENDAITEAPVPTTHYDYLSVPGGINYQEVRVVTPKIEPSIKGHAAFAEDNDIGWLRVDTLNPTTDIIETELQEDLILNSTGAYIKKGTSVNDKHINIYSGKSNNVEFTIENNPDLREDYFDSHDQVINYYGQEAYNKIFNQPVKKVINVTTDKVLRILELQSDLFQKGRTEKLLVDTNKIDPDFEERIETYKDNLVFYRNEIAKDPSSATTWQPLIDFAEKGIKDLEGTIEIENKFLQLLNKDNTWVTVFVKGIIQDAAKKGYDKVLFPLGDTAAKVEGHETLEGYRDEKQRAIDGLNVQINLAKEYPDYTLKEWGEYYDPPRYEHDGFHVIRDLDGEDEFFEVYDTEKEAKAAAKALNKKLDEEIKASSLTLKEEKLNKIISRLERQKAQYEQELARVEGPEGFSALRPVYNFYETTVANILKKQGYNPTLYTDNHGNSWNEIKLNNQRDTQPIQFNSRMTPNQFRKFLNEKYGRKVGNMHFIDGDNSNYTNVRNAIAMYNNERGGFYVELLPTKTNTDFYKQSYFIKTYKNGKGSANQPSGFTIDNFLDAINNVEAEEFKLRDLNAETISNIQSGNIDARELDRAQASQLVAKIAKSIGLTNQDGTAAFNVVTIDQAKLITASAKNELANAPAFVYNNQVYIVEGNLTSENIFHEFSHPFVKALLAYNPALFDNLYNKAWKEFNDSAYADVFRKEYDYLVEGTDSFKEEVIVKTLTRYAQMKLANIPVKKSFADFVNNIMYGIKQMLKALIGKKVNVSELSPTTSLADLANKMLTEEFEIDSTIVGEKDFIDANRRIKLELDEYIKVLNEKIGDPKNNILLQRNLDRFFNVVNTQIQKLLNEKKYADLAGLLVDEFDSKDLQNIRSNISKYTDTIITKAKEVMDENLQNKNKSIAFVNGLRRLEYITNKLHNAIETNIEDLSNIDNLYRVKYYNDFITSYDNFMKVLKKDLLAMKIPTNSPIFTLVNTINANIEASRLASHAVYGEGLLDTFWDIVKPTADKIDERHEKRMNYLKSRNASERVLKLEQASYDSIKLSKETFKRILDGEMDDAGTFNTLLEGYLYNQDPLVGSFALYVKKNFVEVQSSIQMNKTRFMSEVVPALEKAGFNAFNLTLKADTFLYLDHKGIKEDGDLIKTPVWTLLSQFKDYNWWLAEQKFKIAKLNDEYLSDQTDEKKDILNKAKEDFARDLKLYFHQQFKPEYYDREELFERDAVGREAKRLRDEIYDELGQIDESVRNGFEVKDETKRREDALRKLRELSSITDRFGKLKPKFERQIAERLKEYKELSQDLFTWRERSGVFLNDIKDYEDQLILEGLERTDEEFIDKRENFILKNTRIAIKPEFNIFIGTLYERLKELEEKKNAKNKDRIQASLKAKLEKKGVSDNIISQVTTVSDVYSIISDLSSIYKDEDRQTIAADMTSSAIETIKALEEVLDEVRLESYTYRNLSEEEGEYLSDYFIRLKEFDLGIIETEAEKGTPEYDAEMEKISDDLTEEYKYVQELIEKQKDNGLTKKENTEYNKILADLKALRSKNPTQYYLDIYNNFLTTIDTGFIESELDTNIVDSENADSFLRVDIVDEIKSQNSEFAEWFDKNHILTEKYDKAEGEYVEGYRRLSVWEYTLPNDPEYYETTEIPSADGSEIVTIIGQPSLKYFMREVRPEFKTTKVFAGEVDENGRRLTPNVDNKGHWLPKTVAQGAPANSPFLNPEYERLRKDDPNSFDALNILTDYYLSIQEGAEDGVKLYLELPRFTPDTKENITATAVSEDRKNLFKKWWYDTKSFFVRTAESTQEDGLNWQSTEEIPDELEFFVDKSKSIPIEGKAMLKADLVSKDIPRSILRYMASLEKHKKLVELTPVATALQEYMIDPITGKNKSLSQIIKEKLTLRPGSIIVDGGDREDKDKKRRDKARGVREAAIDIFIDKHFYGQVHNNLWGGDSAFLNNFTSFLTKASSFSFFALDIPSALVNYFDAKIQNKIEAYGSKYMNPITYNMGNIWAGKAMTMISAEVYSTGPKSTTVQLVELIDPGQDFLKKSIDDPMSRHILGDLAKLNFLMSPRKWLEFQASLSIMGGMMHHQNVEQIVDGEPRKIRYIDAWEKDANGYLRLKDGIDKKWGRDGEAFKDFRIKVQQVVNNVNGAFADFDQPLASKFLIYRIIAFLQKHFTTMFMNHFAFKGGFRSLFGRTGGLERYDWGTQDVSMGYFIRTLNYLLNGFRTLGQSYMYMSKEEAYAIFKTLRWMASLYITSLIKSMFFGYDDEDKDRFKKMYKRSGPLPIFGAKYNTGYKKAAKFNPQGWMMNNLLYVAIRAQDDTEEWMPLPGFGLSNYTDMMSIKGGAMMKPTLGAYSEILTGLTGLIMDNEDIYYKQESGAYPWLKEGKPKFLKPLVGMFGITGGTTDAPAKIEVFEGYDK